MSVGKSRVLLCIHIGGLQRLIAHDPHGIGPNRGLHPGFPKLLQDGGEVPWDRIQPR